MKMGVNGWYGWDRSMYQEGTEARMGTVDAERDVTYQSQTGLSRP